MSIFRRQNELLGFYLPGFFKISISTNTMNLSDFTPKDMSTYLHEYIHFLQNITTSKGLSDMIFSFHCLCDMFSDIEKCSNFAECLSKYNDNIQNRPGKIQEKKEFFEESEIPNEPDAAHSGKICGIEKDDDKLRYKIFFENNSSPTEPFEYCLNSSVINEGMAHIIEKEIFPEEAGNAPRFPYNILREVSDYLTRQPLTNYELIQLCDLSLQTTCPGIDFIDNLNKFTQGETIEALWQQEVVSQDIVSGKENSSYPAHLGCKVIVEGQVFQEALTCAFEGEIRSDIAKYLNELCYKGACYRETKKQFLFSDLLNENKATIGNALQRLHRILGAPNIFQIDDKHYFGVYAENSIGAPYLPILYDIVVAVYYNTPQIPCPYRSACTKGDHKYHELYDSAICDVDFLSDIKNCPPYCMAKALAFNMGIGNLI